MENKLKDIPEESPAKEKVAGRFSALKQKLRVDADQFVRFVIFMVLIGLGYVYVSHRAEKQIVKSSRLKTEIESLEADYEAVSVAVRNDIRYKYVVQKADTVLGLEDPGATYVLEKKKSE